METSTMWIDKKKSQELIKLCGEYLKMHLKENNMHYEYVIHCSYPFERSTSLKTFIFGRLVTINYELRTLVGSNTTCFFFISEIKNILEPDDAEEGHYDYLRNSCQLKSFDIK